MMGKLGFQDLWIEGTASLYRNANNCVSLAGERPPFFQILRSVRQGCLLVPSLFLLYVEAVSSFLNSMHLNLRGLLVPRSHQCLLNIEFVDDTPVYMQGDMENLKKLECGLSLFLRDQTP